MRAHTEPDFDYQADFEETRNKLIEHRETRWIPERTDSNVLLATWNLTAFGVHERALWHLELMAEILQPFDVIAVQEVGEDLTQLQVLLGKLEGNWRAIYTGVEGDDERLAFLFNTDRVTPGGLATELRVESTRHRHLAVGDLQESFEELHRDPFVVRFEAGDFDFTLVNVHLYRTSSGLRRREAMLLAQWAAARVDAQHPPCGDLILLGDFNLPRLHPGDTLHQQFVDLGMMLPEHETHVVRTNFARDRHYDAMAFFPAQTADNFTGTLGVFDFDQVVFEDLYQDDPVRFYQYVRYCLSDHRPLWIELQR